MSAVSNTRAEQKMPDSYFVFYMILLSLSISISRPCLVPVVHVGAGKLGTYDISGKQQQQQHRYICQHHIQLNTDYIIYIKEYIDIHGGRGPFVSSVPCLLSLGNAVD